MSRVDARAVPPEASPWTSTLPHPIGWLESFETAGNASTGREATRTASPATMLGVWSSIKRVGAIEVGGPRGDLSPRAAAWLVTLLVAVSTVAYGLTTGAVKNIWILPDELTYGLLARSFATTGHFAIRGVDTLAYPIGYPSLIAAAFVHRGPVAAYDAAKWINSLLMSLAAVPTYLIARRLLPRWHSLLAAGLTLLIPSMAYTGVLMSENAFFPLVVLSFLAFVRALEKPTIDRQLVALIAIVPAIAVRAEGLVLIPALLSSMVLLAVCCADRRRSNYLRSLAGELWRFKLTWILLPLSILLLLGGETAVGKSPGAVLGRYSNTLNTYPVLRTLHWTVYQLIDLELYVAILPFVPATIVAFALLRRTYVCRFHRAVAAVAVCSTVVFVVVAAATSQGAQGGSNFNYVPLPPGLHDRYCFFVAPLYLILFVFWVHRRHEYSNRVLIPLLAGAAFSRSPSLRRRSLARPVRRPRPAALAQQAHRREERPLRDGRDSWTSRPPADPASTAFDDASRSRWSRFSCGSWGQWPVTTWRQHPLTSRRAIRRTLPGSTLRCRGGRRLRFSGPPTRAGRFARPCGESRHSGERSSSTHRSSASSTF